MACPRLLKVMRMPLTTATSRTTAAMSMYTGWPLRMTTIMSVELRAPTMGSSSWVDMPPLGPSPALGGDEIVRGSGRVSGSVTRAGRWTMRRLMR